MADEPELISLDDAANVLGFTKLYVRTLVRQGKLKTKKVPIGPASSVWKHMLLADDVANFHKAKLAGTSNSRREDHRNKFTIYLTNPEHKRLDAMLRAIPEMVEVADLIARPMQASAYQRRKQKAAAKLREGVK